MDSCIGGFETRGYAPRTVSPLGCISSHEISQTRTMFYSIHVRYFTILSQFFYNNIRYSPKYASTLSITTPSAEMANMRMNSRCCSCGDAFAAEE